MTVSLPAAVHERLTEGEGTAAEALADLAAEHAQLREAIDTYTDREGRDGPEAGRDLFETPPPVGALVGFEMVDLGDGRSELSFEAGKRHANPMGTLHGGVLCDVGDAAMGTAFASTLDADESFTTLGLEIKFLKPVWEAELTATGEVVHRGRTVGHVECTVTDAEGDVVARLSSICLVLRGEQASGR